MNIYYQRHFDALFFSVITPIPCCGVFKGVVRNAPITCLVAGGCGQPGGRYVKIYKRLLIKANRSGSGSVGCEALFVRVLAWAYRWVRNMAPTPPSKLRPMGWGADPGRACKLGAGFVWACDRGARGE